MPSKIPAPPADASSQAMSASDAGAVNTQPPESFSLKSADALQRLHGSVLKYEAPAEPVWED